MEADGVSTPQVARIQLCGRFLVKVDGKRVEGAFPGRQGRLLFSFLAVRPYRTATRDELVEALWPAALPSAPDMALSALLSKLRRALGDAAITGRGEITLRLPSESWIDVECARIEVHRAESLVAEQRWWEAYGPTVTARYISERPFLQGEAAPWIDEVRAELEEIQLRALECGARVGMAVGVHETAIAIRSAQRLTELAPYRESAYCLLMRALEQGGNGAEALRVYELLRSRLRDDLGIAPGPEAQGLHARLLRRPDPGRRPAEA